MAELTLNDLPAEFDEKKIADFFELYDIEKGIDILYQTAMKYERLGWAAAFLGIKKNLAKTKAEEHLYKNRFRRRYAAKSAGNPGTKSILP